MHCPYVVVAIDVETPGWDHAASFLGQNRNMGPPPCVVNHRQDKGAICQIGWCVFRRVGSGQYRYEQPHSVTVQLPARETISETLANLTILLCPQRRHHTALPSKEKSGGRQEAQEGGGMLRTKNKAGLGRAPARRQARMYVCV